MWWWRWGGRPGETEGRNSDWWICVVNVNGDSARDRISRLIASQTLSVNLWTTCWELEKVSVLRLLSIRKAKSFLVSLLLCFTFSAFRQTNKAINCVETRSEWKINRTIYIMLIKVPSFVWRFIMIFLLAREGKLTRQPSHSIHVRPCCGDPEKIILFLFMENFSPTFF